MRQKARVTGVFVPLIQTVVSWWRRQDFVARTCVAMLVSLLFCLIATIGFGFWPTGILITGVCLLTSVYLVLIPG